MPDLILDIDKEYARKKIFEEFSNYSQEECENIIAAAGFGDRYKYDIREDNANFPSLPAVVALARIFKRKDPTKTIDYFLYKDNNNLALMQNLLIHIPYIEQETDRDNQLIFIVGKQCTTRYDIIAQMTTNPTALVLIKVSSDCMESTVYKNDELFIDTLDKKICDGAIYAFNSDLFKHIQLRRFYIQVNDIKVTADNKTKYDPYMAHLKDINIIGRVVLCRHFLI